MRIAILSIAQALPYHRSDPEDCPAYALTDAYNYLDMRLRSAGALKDDRYADFFVAQVGECLVQQQLFRHPAGRVHVITVAGDVGCAAPLIRKLKDDLLIYVRVQYQFKKIRSYEGELQDDASVRDLESRLNPAYNLRTDSDLSTYVPMYGAS